MKPFFQTFKTWWPALVWTVFGIVLFWPVMGLYQVLPAPDDSPLYLKNAFAIAWDAARVTGTGFTPLSFLPAVMPPLAAHDWAYLIAPLLVMLAGAWWFTARGVERLPALVAGGALGFAGYSFTLVAAGHRGFFDMTVYLMVVFGAMPRALSQQKLFYFALAGAAAGWTLTSQPDFAPVGLAVAALYAVWLLATEAWRTMKWPRLAAGVGVALAFLALTCAGTLNHVMTTLLPGRETVIAQTKQSLPEDAAKKWVFVTDWSLPPEESLELIAPLYKGTGTGRQEQPYWGRLGRAWQWEETKQGFANFRQHTVYIGLAPLLLGLFAVIMWLRSPKKRAPVAGAEDLPQPNPLHDVPFWAVVGLVALVLAFGRYTPFYKLFYSIPYMSFLRAPVKFIRVVEWGCAFLFAAGLTTALRANFSAKTIRNLALGLGAAALVFLLLVPVSKNLMPWSAQMQEVFTAQGIPAKFHAPSLSAAAHAFLHPMWAAFVLAGCVFLLKQKQTAYALILLSAFLAVDTYTVAKPFIDVKDVRMNYAPSAAQPHFDKEENQIICFSDFLLSPRGDSRLNWPLRREGYLNMSISPQQEPDSAIVRLVQSVFAGSPNQFISLVRFARLAGSRFIWLDAGGAAQAVRTAPGAFSDGWYYDFSGNALQPAETPSQNSIALLRLRESLPDAWIATNWIPAATLDEQLAAVLAPAYNPLAAPVTDAPANTNALQSAELLATDLALDPVRGSVTYRATTPAFLTVRLQNNIHIRLTAILEDGTPLPLYTSSLFWTGVEIPPGEHTVTFRRDRRNSIFFYLSLLPIFLLPAWWLANKKWNSVFSNQAERNT